MLRIINSDLDTFLDNIKGKSLYIYGAGNKAGLVYEEWQLQEYVTAIVDGDEQLQGKPWKYDEGKIVISKEQMIDEVTKKGLDRCALLITATFYAADIIEDLDSVAALDTLETYVWNLLAGYVKNQEFEMTKGEQRIPKVIHYCWFGGTEIPQHLQNYMRTWKEKCPDYEIRRWDESNYDIEKNTYMKEAYQCKKWGFVSDYARLDLIYRYGGIYLDTDVEVLRSFDDLLNDRSFFAISYEGSIGTGAGFGAEKGNELIKKLRDEYDGRHFIDKNGNMDLKPCQHYQNPVLREYGFTTRNVYQNIDGNVLYPSEVFAPDSTHNGFTNYTEKTHARHWGNLSWRSEEEREGRKKFKKMCEERAWVDGGGV